MRLNPIQVGIGILCVGGLLLGMGTPGMALSVDSVTSLLKAGTNAPIEKFSPYFECNDGTPMAGPPIAWSLPKPGMRIGSVRINVGLTGPDNANSSVMTFDVLQTPPVCAINTKTNEVTCICTYNLGDIQSKIPQKFLRNPKSLSYWLSVEIVDQSAPNAPTTYTLVSPVSVNVKPAQSRPNTGTCKIVMLAPNRLAADPLKLIQR